MKICSFLVLLIVTFSPEVNAQKELFSSFGEHTKAQFTYRPLDFSGYANAYPGKVNVNAFGDFNFSIPLFEVPGRKLSYPINLTYAPGIKVTQEASWVGLGWSFSDSYVERRVVGLTDHDIPDSAAHLSPDYLNPIYRGRYSNASSDQYFVKLPDGRTATINQHDLGSSASDIYMSFIVEDGKAWDVQYEKSEHRFIVTDESGIKYVFSDAMLGYNYDYGHIADACTNNGLPVARSIRPPRKEPFVKWHLTAILGADYDDNDTTTGADPYDPVDIGTSTSIPKGSWIRIFNELNVSQDKDWRYYTMRQMANTDLNDCSLNGGEGVSPYWTPSRLYELTYPRLILTPTHALRINTEDEPYNPIADILEDKYGKFNEFPITNPPYTWEYHDDFNHEENQRSEKGRRITSIELFENDKSVHYSLLDFTKLIKEVNFEYYNPGESFWNGTGVSFYEERSLLKSITIPTLDEFFRYTFKYENVLSSNDVQTVNLNGTNRNILKCYKSSYEPNKNCNYYSQTNSNSYTNNDDFSSPIINYYRGAFNAATNSSIGADGYLNRNTVLQNAFDNYTFDYTSLEDDVPMWSLERVEFPNGSSQEFEYQSDRYVVDFYHKGKDISAVTFGPTTSTINWGFGIRLKQQTIKGGIGGDKVYSYEYASVDKSSSPGNEIWWDGVTNNGSITDGVGRIYGDPIEIRAPNNCSESLDGYQCRQELIPPTDYVSNQTERRVVYGRIKENQPGGSSITTYFNVPDLDENRSSVPLLSDSGQFNEIMGNRGEIKSVEYHDDNGLLVYREEKNNTELLRTNVTDQVPFRKFTYWLSESENTSTTVYSGQNDVSSATTKVFNEENGLVAEKETSDPTGVSSKSKKATFSYMFESNPSFKDANWLSAIDNITNLDIDGSTETILNSTKFNYNTSDLLQSVVSGYLTNNELNNIHSIVYDDESLMYEFSDASSTRHAVHYTNEARIATAIFSNASYNETFYDDFQDGDYTDIYQSTQANLGFWGFISGSWVVEAGKLKHISGTGKILNALPSSLNKIFYNLEFDMYPNKDGIDSEIRFGMNSGFSSYYKIIVRNTNSGNKDLKLYRTSTLKSSASISEVTKSYKDPMHIKIRVNGTKIEVFANGKKMVSYVDPSILTGDWFGFYISSNKSKQSFDNVRIYPFDAVVVSQGIENKFLKVSNSTSRNGINVYNKYDELGRLSLRLGDAHSLQTQTINSVANNLSEVVSYTNETPIRGTNLIGFWRFDQSIDGLYSNFDTRVTGNPLDYAAQDIDKSFLTYPSGRVGNAAYSSSDEFAANPVLFDYGDLDQLDSPTKFTFAGWFFREPHEPHMNGNASLVTQEGVHNILIANSSSSTNNDNTIQIGTYGNNIEVYLNTVTGGAGKETVNAGIVDNKWYHIAMTYEGNLVSNTTKLYLDGELIKTWDAQGGYWYDNLVFTNSPFTIGGANPTDPDGLFNGYVDEFLLLDEVLNASEISSLSNRVIASRTVSDNLGSVKSEASKGWVSNENLNSISVDNEYDIKGRKISTTRPNSTEKILTTYYQDPLNRVKEIKLPSTGGTTPTTTFTYYSNTSSEQFTSFDSYGAGTLHKVVSNDPNGKQNIEYTNSIGQTIASIVDMDGSGTKTSGDLITEFGYDDLGNITRIKDPRGLTTQYEYDIHSRLTRKKLPDQDNWVDYKYNKLGNVRFVQTAEHKLLGSIDSESLINYGTQSFTKVLNADKAGLIEYNFSIVDLFYDGFDILISDNDHNATFYEKSLGGDASEIGTSMTISKGDYKFTGQVQDIDDEYYSSAGTFKYTPYQYSYTKYDNLNRMIEVGEYYGSTSFTLANPDNGTFPTSNKRVLIEYKYDEENGYSGARNLAGNLAQVWYYNPNDFTQAPSKIYYSYNEQSLVEWIVQELRNDNGVNITKTIEYVYDKAGNLLEIRYNPGGSDSFYQRYTYDGLGRVNKAESSLTGSAGEWLTSAEYDYNSGGELEQLILGENAQIVDYTYDTRGWLTGINNSASVGSGPQQDRFFQSLDYFSSSVTYSKRQYNGNIAQQTWGYDTRLINKPDQSYLYTYDSANRLDFADRFGSGYVSGAFDVDPTYDKNGNITSMIRKNETGSTSSGSHFGNFFMVHSGSSNRINYVEDVINQITYDIDYDANGNLIKNEKHNLKKTSYDLTNMPVRSISGSGVIQYRYGPDGQRVAKSVLGGTGNLYLRGANGETLAVYDKNGTLLFHNVLVGSEIIGKTN